MNNTGYCGKCGNKLVDDSNFCGRCGTKISSEETLSSSTPITVATNLTDITSQTKNVKQQETIIPNILNEQQSYSRSDDTDNTNDKENITFKYENLCSTPPARVSNHKTQEEVQINSNQEDTYNGLNQSNTYNINTNLNQQQQRAPVIADVQQQQYGNKKKDNKLLAGIIIAIILIIASIVFTSYKLICDKSAMEINTTTSSNSTTDTGKSETPPLVPKEKEYKKGILTSTSYESEFIGIRYTPASPWVLSTDDEVAKLSADENTIFEMQSTDSSNGSNFAIGIEKLPTKNLTEKMYVDIVSEMLKENKELNATSVTTDTKTVIADNEYSCIVAKGSRNGVFFTQTYCVRKINDRMVIIIVTSTKSDTEKILSTIMPY